MNEPAPRPGVCQFCGCTETTPCFNLSTHEACAWLDGSYQTCCTTRNCQLQYADLYQNRNELSSQTP